MLANPTASGEVSTLGAIRMNREQARSYRCNRVPVNGYLRPNPAFNRKPRLRHFVSALRATA